MYAAKIANGAVTQVIVGSSDWAASRLGGTWKTAEFKVGAGWGWTKTYGFRPPKPYASWKWIDGSWQAPSAYPSDGGDYVWDESSRSWVEADAV